MQISAIDSHNWTIKKITEMFPDAKTLTDAKESLGLIVTSRDVARARPRDPSRCAVACAAKRQVKGLEGALINKSSSILVWKDGRAVRYQTPVATYAKILAFDIAGTAEPGLYTLSRVPPSHRLNKMAQRGEISRKARARKTWNGKKVKKTHLKSHIKPFLPSKFRAWGVIPESDRTKAQS